MPLALSPSLQSGVRFRAYPTREQATTLAQWIGCQRVIYNAKVQEDGLFSAQWRSNRFTEQHELLSPLDQQYSQFKDEELTPWLSQVPSQVLRNGAVRWRTAKQRQLQGLARAPVTRKRHNFNSVMLTSELFELREALNTKGQSVWELHFGTPKFSVGVLKFKAHRPFGIPKSITVRRESREQWFVSFNYEHASPVILRTSAELAYEHNNLTDEALATTTIGLDRNVRDNFVAASTGEQYAVPQRLVERIERKAVGRKRYQRQLARQKLGSRNREKTKRRIARNTGYGRNVRRDFAHKTSRTLVDSPVSVFVFEDLRIKNMVRAPVPKAGRGGKYLPNGARAKAGLNRSILESCWGMTEQFLSYKAQRQNKLVLAVPPHHTSQACSRCGHTHPDNRRDARFVCTACGFEEHADFNAALNIKARGIALVRSGTLESSPEPRKRVAFTQRKSYNRAGPPEVPVEPR